jgi:hypothetical protein
MAAGIAFSICAADEPELRSLPPPSGVRRLSTIEGKNKVIQVFYHFRYAPQSWKQWQQAANVKVQIQEAIPSAKFDEYTPGDLSGPVYTITELIKRFRGYVRWPKPLFPSAAGEQYQMLCRYAKRLHYEGKLHLEQLIATSLRFNEGMSAVTDHPKKGKQGARQVLQLAKAAHTFALEHRDGWPVKLDDDERHEVLSAAARKAAATKRDKSAAKQQEAAKLRQGGERIDAIAKALEVSPATVKRWLKSAGIKRPKKSKTAH